MCREILVLLSFSFTATLISSDCVPRVVENLTLSANSVLSWTISSQETCTIDHFTITVNRNNEFYSLKSHETNIDVSFLPYCASYVFTVRAVSEDILSAGHILIARTPLPSDAEIALEYLGVTGDWKNQLLVWDLEDQMYKSCADRFRVVVRNEDNGDIADLYVTDNFLNLNFLSPCVVYDISVRPVSIHGEEGSLRSIEYDVPPAKQNPPRLDNIETGTTTVNMTWILDNRSTNGCPLSSFYIDGGQHFNISFPIADTPLRDPVPIHLQSLRPSSLYVLRVSIENSGGISDAVVIGVQTLDPDPGA